MRYGIVIASLMLPNMTSAGLAQGLPIDYDAEAQATVSLAQAGLSQMAEHPDSTTETSPARARSVRRGGRTIMLIENNSALRPASIVARVAIGTGS